MVLIDLYSHSWTSNALDLLKKRTGFLEGKFDEKNRKQVDWKLLQIAIDEAPAKCNNTEFFDYYYR